MKIVEWIDRASDWLDGRKPWQKVAVAAVISAVIVGGVILSVLP